MELKIAVDELSKALFRAQGIVDRKTTMPILANVLLSASKEGRLKVTAFDLDIGVVSEHPAEVIKEGEITLQARTLFDIVKNLPEASVTLRKQENHYVELQSGQATFRIVGMSADQYPPLPKEEKAALAKVDGKALLALIEKTSFAISTDETRYVLNGVYLEASDGTARMVATDGHRLALAEAKLGPDFKLKRGVIVPRKGLFELKRLLEEAPDAEVHLGFAEASGIFRKPGLSMVMRLIDGQFPEYQQVIPKVAERALHLQKVKLLETLKRVSLLSAEKAHAVKLQLVDGALKITSQNPELGEAKEELPVDYTGKALSIGFNARYLIDGLQALEGEDVRFELGDDSSPGVLRPATGQGYTAVIMPMRI
ncbi:MAG: DNA polymerase III subunit beta [Deltaproteobacteria bacterium]|nr:DNA polymerase III subunit beta [Deltaproteobacteria bacterium]